MMCRLKKTNLCAAAQYKGWTCYIPEQQTTVCLPGIDELLEIMTHFPETLKNDKRSLVKKGRLFGRDVIVKRPVDKNRRVWSRLLSFVRCGESKQTALTLMQFARINIATVTPLLVLEKRSYGMLVDSWIAYEYGVGTPANKSHLAQIVQSLTVLHRHGFRHDDPNFGNFLLTEDSKLFLIDCKGRPRVGSFTDYYDFILLAERNPDVSMQDIKKYIEIDESSLGYRLALFYANYKCLRTNIKRKLRKSKLNGMP